MRQHVHSLRQGFFTIRLDGSLVLADLNEHSGEWMRAEMADVWLGLSRSAMRKWMEKAGCGAYGQGSSTLPRGALRPARVIGSGLHSALLSVDPW